MLATHINVLKNIARDTSLWNEKNATYDLTQYHQQQSALKVNTVLGRQNPSIDQMWPAAPRVASSLHSFD